MHIQSSCQSDKVPHSDELGLLTNTLPILSISEEAHSLGKKALQTSIVSSKPSTQSQHWEIIRILMGKISLNKFVGNIQATVLHGPKIEGF